MSLVNAFILNDFASVSFKGRDEREREDLDPTSTLHDVHSKQLAGK